MENFLSLTFILYFSLYATGYKFPRISVNSNGWFQDNKGRIRFFHGINAVHKASPWYPENLLNLTKLKNLEEWGFNAVRLGTMWSGMEPKQGEFSESYTNVMLKIVNLLENYGMYALLDMHQDVMAAKFGTYDGFPTWLVERFTKPVEPFPWPFKKITQWAEGYVTEACSQAFQDFYNNYNGTQEEFVKFWAHVASIFKNHTSILGYELINEPWAGNPFADPLVMLPGVAGKKNLMPMYNKINEAIRVVDNHTIIFFEPVTWGVVFNKGIVGTGFTTVPGGDEYLDRSALSYHYYCWALTTQDFPKPYNSLKRFGCDKLLGPEVFKTVVKEHKAIGGGALLTEFGECEPDKNKNSTNTIECEFVLNLADSHLQSWTYWDSLFYDSQGNVRYETVKPFARTYPRAIAGVPTALSFNVDTAEFSFEYEVNLSASDPTEIFIPPLHYPKGYVVTVSSFLKWVVDPNNKNVILVTPNKDFAYVTQNSVGSVCIKPKEN